MAIVRKTPEATSRTGLAATYHGSLSTSDTYIFANNGRIVVHFKKSGAGDCTVTLDTPRTYRGKALENPTVTIPATTGDKFVGPLDRAVFNDGAGDASFTLSNITGLTMALLRLP